MLEIDRASSNPFIPYNILLWYEEQRELLYRFFNEIYLTFMHEKNISRNIVRLCQGHFIMEIYFLSRLEHQGELKVVNVLYNIILTISNSSFQDRVQGLQFKVVRSE